MNISICDVKITGNIRVEQEFKVLRAREIEEGEREKGIKKAAVWSMLVKTI